jgi:hypothetical protein
VYYYKYLFHGTAGTEELTLEQAIEGYLEEDG